MRGRMINTKEMIKDTQENIIDLITRHEIQPTLKIIQVGDESASNSYVKNKIKMGEKLGIKVIHEKLDESVNEDDIISYMYSNSNDIDGIIVQLPLPKHINERLVLDSIPYNKDVDGLGTMQMGHLNAGDRDVFEPCTAFGVMSMLTKLTKLKGKDVVIVNRSHLIGRPLQKMLTDADATVTLCHSKTKNLKDKVKNADIVITGIGKAGYFDSSWFSDGQILIDCSMNMDENMKLCGDVKLQDVLDNVDVDIASGTGHTGPFTVTCLMINTVRAHIKNKKNRG